MRASDAAVDARIRAGLARFETAEGTLPGIVESLRRESLFAQFIESDRRVRYLDHVATARLGAARADPSSDCFDPMKAAVLMQRDGDYDEALWLLFLAIHLGRHRSAGWRYASAIYGGLGGDRWNWSRVSDDPARFRVWLHENYAQVKGTGSNGFGNHRKRESLSGFSDSGTGAVVESYVDWIGPSRSHEHHFESLQLQAGCDPGPGFDRAYESMRVVHRFGRLARFDYLTTAGRLGLLPVLAGCLYLRDSTGPLAGARLLFGSVESVDRLDERAARLGITLGVPLGVVEDALCNWQKSPDTFKAFRG